jgi:AcrR family transcriptional regulator
VFDSRTVFTNPTSPSTDRYPRPVTTGRPDLRARRREETGAVLREIAGRHLAEHGAAGLSLRAVARDAGMAVSNVYRYFPSRDELLTDLLVQAFGDHADAVEAATAPHLATGDPATALRAGFTAYRRWALERRAEFGLAYGAPVPGYDAPHGRTLVPGTRIGAHLVRILAACHERGLVDGAVVAARLAALTPATARRLETMRAELGYEAPVGLIAVATDGWVRLHGCVSMEVFGQLRYVAGDDDAYFRETLDLELVRCGLAG